MESQLPVPPGSNYPMFLGLLAVLEWSRLLCWLYGLVGWVNQDLRWCRRYLCHCRRRTLLLVQLWKERKERFIKLCESDYYSFAVDMSWQVVWIRTYDEAADNLCCWLLPNENIFICTTSERGKYNIRDLNENTLIIGTFYFKNIKIIDGKKWGENV